MNVDLRAWNQREALAIVDGVRVRVNRLAGRRIRWRCYDCGDQINAPTCPHALAFAAHPIPPMPETTKGQP